MTDRAERVLGAVYRVHGRAALYQPPGGGAAVDCTIRFHRPSVSEGSIGVPFNAAAKGFNPSLRAHILMVPQAEVAAPEAGGVFTEVLSGAAWRVGEHPTPEGDEGLEWRCKAAKD